MGNADVCDKREISTEAKAMELKGQVDDDNKFSDEHFKSSIARKALCVCTVTFYLVGCYILMNTRIRILDEWTDKITPNILSRSFEYCINFLTSGYSKFHIAVTATAIFHQVAYWILCAPGFLYQFLPFMRKYKIQDRDVSWELQWKCLKLVAYNQCFIELPVMILNYYFVNFMNYGWTYDTFPRWYQLLAAMIGALAIEDAWHYFAHHRLHQGNFYQIVHKLHHEFVTPVGMQADYAHPLEVFALAIGFTLGCCFYCNHFFCTWIWMIVRITETIEVHGGYDCILFFNFFHYLPFYGGPRFHDFHHMNFVGNYASTFTCWDEIFDTIVPYRKYYAKKKLLSPELCKENKLH